MARAKYSKRKDGLYAANRTINGHRKVFYGRTCAEVDAKIRAYMEDAEKGKKFPERAEEWTAIREPQISESTRKAYSYAVERLKAAFPGYVRDIKPIDIERYMAAFADQGYKAATVNTEYTVLKQILAFAVIQGDADSNAADMVKRPKAPATKRTALTEDQERRVQSCRTGEWWLLGMMLLYTGGRRGEVLALTWEDVDQKAGVIHFCKKLNYAYGNRPKLEDHMKSENGVRDVPIFPPLAAVLPHNRIGKIFHGPDGEYLTASRLSKAWYEYCREAGLEGVTPHQFRHSFATLCMESGIRSKAAAAWMGDTEKVVETVYQELRAGKAAEDAEKMGEYLKQKAMQA